MESNIDDQAKVLAKAFQSKGVEINTALQRGLEESSMLVEARAVLLAPVDTGLLRKSITHRVIGNVGEVGTSVEYATFQEFGTVKIKKQPFLLPALQSSRAAIKGIITKWIRTKI